MTLTIINLQLDFSLSLVLTGGAQERERVGQLAGGEDGNRRIRDVTNEILKITLKAKNLQRYNQSTARVL
jgi:hypothetical protein